MTVLAQQVEDARLLESASRLPVNGFLVEYVPVDPAIADAIYSRDKREDMPARFVA